MKAYEYAKMAGIMELAKGRKDDGKNHTGANIVKAMTGKMMSVIIRIDNEGILYFERVTSGTRIKEYGPGAVANVMALTGKGINEKVTMQSLSTSSLKNERCKQRSLDPESICAYCFANAAQSGCDSRSCGMKRNLTENFDILAWNVVNYDDIPVITSDFFRFESHGDLNSFFQVINYFMFCEKALENGSNTRFALWTKNPDFVDYVITKIGIEKPANLEIQISSEYLNVVMDIRMYPWADRVFTVWTDRETCENAGHHLNCCDGIRMHTYCIGCTNCYVKGNGVIYVNELLREK